MFFPHVLCVLEEGELGVRVEEQSTLHSFLLSDIEIGSRRGDRTHLNLRVEQVPSTRRRDDHKIYHESEPSSPIDTTIAYSCETRSFSSFRFTIPRRNSV